MSWVRGGGAVNKGFNTRRSQDGGAPSVRGRGVRPYFVAFQGLSTRFGMRSQAFRKGRMSSWIVLRIIRSSIWKYSWTSIFCIVVRLLAFRPVFFIHPLPVLSGLRLPKHVGRYVYAVRIRVRFRSCPKRHSSFQGFRTFRSSISWKSCSFRVAIQAFFSSAVAAMIASGTLIRPVLRS